jgi:hypothetical protein
MAFRLVSATIACIGVTTDLLDEQLRLLAMSPSMAGYLEHRIGDKRIIHLIQKWLRAGTYSKTWA